MPLSKEEALSRGFKWRDDIPFTSGQETKQISDLPQNPEEYREELTKEILSCESCNKNYRFINSEILFYKRMKLPLPTKCFNCRHEARMKSRNPRSLWNSKCDKCSQNIKTSYNIENQKKYKIYCEKCYQQEVY